MPPVSDGWFLTNFALLHSERYINELIVTELNEQEERATGRAGEAAAGDF